jgi:Tol biopolymer transport system component
MLVPERSNASVELTELGGEDDVVSLGQTVQEIGALLACPLGLGTDFGKCSHHMKKRRGHIRHSLVLACALLAGCMGDEEERSEIAYGVVREDAPTRIVVVEDDGTDARRVSGAKFRANPVLPTWSRDGQRLAFVRFTPAAGPQSLRTSVVNADGTGERELGEGTLPEWTRDGRFIVVERPRLAPQKSTIWVLSADGSGQRRLTVGSAPTASHRGSRIAFVRYTFGRRPRVVTSSSLYTVSLDGTGLRLLARTTDRNVTWVQPKWLPDDSAVAVAQRTGAVVGSGPLLTFSMTGRRRVIVPKVGETYDWSPKRDLVAYTLGGIVYVIRPDGTEVDSFGESNAIDLEWSPDGTKVALSIQEILENGQFVGLYLIDVEEGERRRFVITDGSVAYLDWRPKPGQP